MNFSIFRNVLTTQATIIKKVLVVIIGFIIAIISFSGCEEKKSETLVEALKSKVHMVEENEIGIRSFFIVDNQVKIVERKASFNTVESMPTYVIGPAERITTISYVRYYFNKDTLITEGGKYKFFFRDGKIIWQFECDQKPVTKKEISCELELIPKTEKI